MIKAGLGCMDASTLAKAPSATHIEHESCPDMVFQSACMKAVVERIEKAARHDVDVLFLGETGTGKDLAAEHLARQGKRRGRSPVHFNCSGIPPTLQQGQLLGSRSGAYTGATRDTNGMLFLADGGVLILSDIQDLSLDAQSTLRSFFDRRVICRLGECEERRIDVQIVATMNREFQDLCRDGGFRADLYERFARLVVRIPPLRQRREDIPVLVHHTLRKLTEKYGRRISELDSPFWEFALTYDWPRNVRQLQNVLEQATIEEESSVLHFATIRGRLEGDGTSAMSLPKVWVPEGRRKRLSTYPSRRDVEEALERRGNRIADSAHDLGVSLRTFYRLRKSLGMI